MLVSRFTWIALLAIPSHAIASNSISRVSLDPLGNPLTSSTHDTSFSRDGKRVTFATLASNVVANDSNGVADVFVRDLVSGQSQLVSTTATGVQGNGASIDGRISPDGRFVAFATHATNLAANDTNGAKIDVYVKDLVTGALTYASCSAAGVAGNDSSLDPRLSADGRFVVFSSSASNLVSNDTNGKDDVFLRDLQTGQIECLSVDPNGIPASGVLPAISGDARFIAYCPLVSFGGVVVLDRQLGTRKQICLDWLGAKKWGAYPAISEDGSTIVFLTSASLVVEDAGIYPDLYFVRNVGGSLTLPKLVTPGGDFEEEDPLRPLSLSSDGRFVTFGGSEPYVAADLNSRIDVYVADLVSNTYLPVSKGPFGFGNSDSTTGCISGDGRSCVITSKASNLVAGDSNAFTEVFVVDLSGEAKWKSFGSGVSGSAGSLDLALQTEPELGKTNALVVSVATGSIPAIVLLGVIPFTSPTPFGGSLFLVPTSTLTTTATAGGTSLPFLIRNDPELAGQTFYAQALGIDTGAPKGISFSAAIEAVIGN